MKKVWIEDGCTSCGLCEETCPEVFEIDDVSTVKKGVNYSEFKDEIIESAENCPVEVIQYEE